MCSELKLNAFNYIEVISVLKLMKGAPVVDCEWQNMEYTEFRSLISTRFKLWHNNLILPSFLHQYSHFVQRGRI